MDSLTMEIEKAKRDELDHVHEQGLSDAQTSKALHSEADLSERDEAFDETLDDDDHRHVDYSNYSKQQFVDLVKELSRESNFKKIDGVLKEIKPLYEDIHEKERLAALEKFKSSGGEPGLTLKPAKHCIRKRTFPSATKLLTKRWTTMITDMLITATIQNNSSSTWSKSYRAKATSRRSMAS